MDGYETRNDLEKGAVGFVELTRRLIVPGADQRRQQDREDCRLLGPKSELLPGCVTLANYLPLCGPPFTDWGTDIFLQGGFFVVFFGLKKTQRFILSQFWRTEV